MIGRRYSGPDALFVAFVILALIAAAGLGVFAGQQFLDLFDGAIA